VRASEQSAVGPRTGFVRESGKGTLGNVDVDETQLIGVELLLNGLAQRTIHVLAHQALSEEQQS
jgi:hypothetical protein